jgi:hypothetical protein
MTAYPDAPSEKTGSRDARVFGVRLQCDNPCDSQCHENVYGHGSSATDAYEIACEKFHRPSK